VAAGVHVWQPTATLFTASDPSFRIGEPEVAVDGKGRATAIWLLASGTGGQGVMEADWSATRGWTRARPLTAFGTHVAWPLALAVDARGDAVIAWAANREVRESYRPAGREWHAPRTLSASGDSAGSPLVALDDQGRALVAWSARRGSPEAHDQSFEIAARSATGAWGKPKTLCACNPYAALRMNAGGQALVVWSPFDLYVDTGLWAETRSADGRWSAREEISTLGAGPYFPLALNARGGAAVAWVAANNGHLMAAIRPAHGPFGPPQVIAANAYWGYDLALAPTGEGVVTWAAGDSAVYAMARLPGASAFTSEQLLAPASASGGFVNSEPVVGADVHGNALALWTRATGRGIGDGELYVHAAERPAGGSFDSGGDLADIGPDSYKHSACNGGPAIATAADGSAVAVWLAHPNSHGPCTTVEAAAFKG
jgi:hypothetical protein